MLVKLTIERVSNGYILTTDDSENRDYPYVLEEDEDDEIAHHQSLLFSVMDYFDFSGSKHDEERIVICRKKQAGC